MEKNNKNIPVIYLDIDELDMKSGMDALSFVSSPATEITWTMFKSENIGNDILTKAVFEKDKNGDYKKMITSPIMLAETEILRFNPIIGHYYVKFTEDTILKMMKKYFKENKIHRINEQHDPTRAVDNVFMVESFIVGDNVKSELYPDIPKGSWVATFYVEDDQYWNDKVLNGEFTGFSLEGGFIEMWEKDLYDMIYSKIEEVLFSESTEDQIIEELKNILNL